MKRIEITTKEQLANVAKEIEAAVNKEIEHLDGYFTNTTMYVDSYVTIRIFDTPDNGMYVFSYIVIERIQRVVKRFAEKYYGINYLFTQAMYAQRMQPVIDIDIVKY